MVKLTIVGRVNDGLPLAQTPRYVNYDNSHGGGLNFSSYQQQAEFLLQEISRGGLPSHNRIIIPIDPYFFSYMVENGVCFITMCESSYPRKLAFHYLQDLGKEFEKFDTSLIQKLTKPYSFVKFDGIIGSIRRQYLDTRTQANLSKLNVNCREELDVTIMSESMSQIIKRRRRSEMLENLVEAHNKSLTIWGSEKLVHKFEVVALKWTPITIIVIVMAIILWSSLMLNDEFIVPRF